MTARRVGPYVIEGLLGRGGMGEVYKAYDEKLERHVAIKLIRASAVRSETLKHFLREARTAARLSHPAIVQIYHVEEVEGDDCIVMELIDGEPLAKLVCERPLDYADSLALACQIADGLAEAHAKGVVHRDLKTENVMVTRDGHAKILDFGLAKPLPSNESDSVSDQLTGTPRAMSPEQVNEEPVDPRSDIFSFGTLLYELCTGRSPFRGRTPLAVLHQVCYHRPPPVRELNPEVPLELSQLVGHMMEKRPQGRPRDVREVREVLGRLHEARPGRSSEPWNRVALVHDERRQVTVLCCIFSTPPGHGGNSSVLASGFLNSAGEVVQRHLGSVLKATPRSLVACFGYPRAYGDDACRAVRTALAIQDLYRSGSGKRDSTLEMRLGLHTGVADFAGQPGPGPLAEEHDPWSRAIKVVSSCDPGATWLSKDTFLLVRHAFVAEGPHKLREGRAYKACGLIDRRGATAAGDVSPLVGRREELDLMEERWRLAREGRGQVVLVSGEAGIGKSRLISALGTRLGLGPKDSWSCRSSAQFQNSAFRPVIALLWQLLATERGARPDHHLTRLEELTDRYGLAVHLPLLADLLGLSVERRELPGTRDQQSHTVEAVLELLLALAAEQPRMWVVEDLHWTDPSTLDLLDRLVDQVPTTRLLLVLSFRSRFRPPWVRRGYVLSLALTGLMNKDSKELIRRRCGEVELSVELIDRILDSTDGVPLFVEELTRLVVDSELVRRADGTYDVSRHSRRLEVPTTLRDALMERLDRLGSIKQLAQMAAVFGRAFSYEVLESVSPIDGPTLKGELDRLVDAELLYRQGVSKVKYYFKHALIRQAAYESLGQGKRCEYHADIARALEEEFSDTVRLHPEILAHHHTEACQADEAVRWWLHAGQKAWADIESTRHLERGLELLATMPSSPERHELELRYHSVLGPKIMAVKGFAAPEVKSSYDRRLELQKDLGEAPDFKTLWGYWRFYSTVGDWEKAFELARRLESLAEESGHPTELSVALRSVGGVLFHMGQPRAARGPLERGIAAYDGEDGKSFSYVHHPKVNCQAYAAWVLWQLGFPDQALAVARDSLALARRLGEPYTLALALATLCLIHRLRLDNAEILSPAQEQIQLARKHQFSLPLAGAKLFHGGALAASGSRAEGLAEMREGLGAWKAAQANASLTFILADVAQTCLDSEDVELGRQALDEAAAIVAFGGESFYQAELLRLRGELLLLEGDEAGARHLFAEAMRCAAEQGALGFELRAALSSGRWLRRKGRVAEASEVVGKVRRRFTEGFETVDLREASAFRGLS